MCVGIDNQFWLLVALKVDGNINLIYVLSLTSKSECTDRCVHAAIYYV